MVAQQQKARDSGNPDAAAEPKIEAGSGARANTSSTDVTSSRNTESGIRFVYKTQGYTQEGIRNPGSRGKRDYIRGTTRELRGKP